MACPRCNERFNLEILFDCEITYPFKRGGTNVIYDFLFLRCKGCNQEYAVRDDGLELRRTIEKREEIKHYAAGKGL